MPQTRISSRALRCVGFALLVLSGACSDARPELAKIQATQEKILAKLEALEARVARAAPVRRAAAPADDFDTVQAIEVGASPILGKSEAPVTLVAYSDFQCPYCAQASPQMQELQARYPDQVRVVFKHFPLSFHKAAQPVAVASMAAQEQDRFWAFHDAVFADYQSLTGTREQILEIAERAGLDVARFERDLEANRSRYEARVTADQQQGKQLGVRGTPTLYLNGKCVRDRSVAGLSRMVDSALREGKREG